VVAAGALPGAGPSFELDGDGVVEPSLALDALAARARSAGAAQVSGEVLAVDEDAAGLLVRLGPGPVRTVRAEVVVYAAALGSAAIEPYFEDKLVPIREQAVWTAPVAERFPGAWRLGFGLTFLRQRADGGLVVGGCRWATPHLEVGERAPVTVDKVQDRIDAFAKRHLPPLTVLERRAWIETHTCDGLPIVGPLPGAARRIACVGFCGNDWGLAPAAAQAVADGLLGEVTAVPSFLSASRFL
jgi:glycine/D-amino acid oxidase-like deaminating enzyme